jgi:Protein of unknown function (DUF3667)
MKKHYRAENNCLNCGATLQGKFCDVCGQENLEIKESFGHMMNHAISDYFHFDEQFFRTLKPLLFKPGKLTQEYMAGRRVSYLHPIKMYIFISFIYFLVAFYQNQSLVVIKDNGVTHKELAEINNSIKSSPFLTAAKKKSTLEKINQFKIVKGKDGKTDTIYPNLINRFVSQMGDTTYEQYLTSQQKLPAAKRDGTFMRKFTKMQFKFSKDGNEKGKELSEAITHDMPKLMFLLLPMFALILKIAFSRSKKFYIEHLIYSFHLHSFVFLVLTFVLLLQLVIPAQLIIIGGILSFLSFIYMVWYFYRSLRIVYGRNRFRTITKMIGIGLSYLVVFSVAMTLFVLTIIEINALT